MKTPEPLEQAAAEFASDAPSQRDAERLTRAFMAGAEHALRIAQQPGGVDALRQQIVEHGRLLGAERRAA